MKSRYDFSNAIVGKYVGRIAHRTGDQTAAVTWRNPSVKLLAGGRDPAEVIVEKAREVIFGMIDAGHFSLPIDPFKLAERLSVEIVPSFEVRDARTICGTRNRPIIEYNPSRPRARSRFSICHELAHTLFPDCTQQVRHRLFHTETSPVTYELEMLCNLAAAEFLLPIGSIQEDLSKFKLSIDSAIDLRLKYEASVEAVLLRLAGLSGSHCAVFAAVTDEGVATEPRRHRIEYVKTAQKWPLGLKRGDYLPNITVANHCTAIGFTAKASEEWVSGAGKLKVEMVGVSPYPNRVMPRIVGLIRPLSVDFSESSEIRYVRGDALLPRGADQKVIAHVVNDQTPNWGAGFGKSVQLKWPEAHRSFKGHFEDIRGTKLGHTFMTRVADDVCLFQMISQRGYGPSKGLRLRYAALQICLEKLRDEALRLNASVHMPRIGAGEAGGSWGIIANIISEELCAKGISVTIYDLPSKRTSQNRQSTLFQDQDNL